MNAVPDLMKGLLDFDPRGIEVKSSQAPSEVFKKISEDQALNTFKIAAATVPAYKDFLKRNKVSPDKIGSIEDFHNIPLTDKKNYLTKYPLKDLMIGGTFQGKSAITSSSGSSGKPLYWPRTPEQDFGATKGWDSFLVNNFDIDKKSTFHMNCSGMGIWTAGDYVGILNKYLSYKYQNNTSISPGIDLDNSIKLLEDIAPNFSQTIIYSYPPFAKDIVDSIPTRLIKKFNLRFVVYGEPYSETWRRYILDKIGGGDNYHYVTSVLGSSEGGLIGIESKACSILRLEAYKNSKFCEALFKKDQVPSLIQYSPQSKYIENVGNDLILTNIGGVPLVRYNTHDFGGVLYKENIADSYDAHCKNTIGKLLKKHNTIFTSLPFLYVFGRSDYTASIYGVLIHPQTLKDILTTKPFSKFFSGKFVMSTTEDKEANQYLSLVIETKKNVDKKDIAIPPFAKLFAEHIAIYSSEYSKLLSSAGRRVFPQLDIRNYGDSDYFSSRNKQQYLI